MQASPRSDPRDNLLRRRAQHRASRRPGAPGTARRSGADPAAPRARASRAGSPTRGWSAGWPAAGPARFAVSRYAPRSRPPRRDARGALDHHRHLIEAREVHGGDHFTVEEEPVRLPHTLTTPPIRGPWGKNPGPPAVTRTSPPCRAPVRRAHVRFHRASSALPFT